MSNTIKVFDLSNASDVSLTSAGFKKGNDTAKYVCKITDATIEFTGDNMKFITENNNKGNPYNYIFISLPEEQSKEFMRILLETNRTNLPHTEYEGKSQFKVKLSPNTKIVDKEKKPIKINLQKVPCVDLREYKDSTIDIVLTGSSNEFESKKTNQKFSFVSLEATQIKIKCRNNEYECDFL